VADAVGLGGVAACASGMAAQSAQQRNLMAYRMLRILNRWVD
jgi:hypothetical protein